MQNRPYPSFPYVWAAVLSIAVAVVISFRCAEREGSSSPLLPEGVSEGERLVRQHCGTCHLPVSASALDRETWLNNVLPVMASKVGIDVLWGEYYPRVNDSTGGSVSMANWTKIVEYYENEAPDTLDVPAPPASRPADLSLFSVREPQWENRQPAATIMVAVDSSTRHVYYTDVVAGNVYRSDEKLESTAIVRSSLLGVDVRFVEDATGDRHGIFTSIGTMRAVNVADGEVWDVNLSSDADRVIANNLPRPVCSRPGDFDRDGLQDWIVCGFGHDIGGLYLFEQQPDRTFEKKTIRSVPGAVDAQTGDFNGDGWLDVMVLFAHGDEGIWLFTNDRDGGFDRRNLLRFPPVYGSTHFQLADFNGDGALDILYTSGDNDDYSKILKPYHGIYIFTNRGNFQYEQSYFYHFNGATEAVAVDFDRDGDLDIAAIAFFARLESESARDFVYLEQTEPLAFTPHAPPLPYAGRKMNMDAGDYDGDTDVDLILGNYAARGYLYQGSGEADSTAHVPFIVLENETQ